MVVSTKELILIQRALEIIQFAKSKDPSSLKSGTECVDIDEQHLHNVQCMETSVYFNHTTLEIKSKSVLGSEK